MKLDWLRPAAFVGVVLLAGIACTLDTGGLGNEAPPVVKGEVADKVGVVVCDWYYQCGCEDLDGSPYTSENQCADAIGAGIQAAVDEGDAAALEYDAQCAGNMVQLFADLGCDGAADLGIPGLVSLSDQLQCKLFFGEDEVGSACASLQLSTGDSCVRDAQCEAGTCQATEKAPQPGDECEQQDACSGGAFCLDVDGVNDFVCEVLPGASETCRGVGDYCGEGLTCKQTSKICVPAPEAGEQCSSTLFACAQGLFCHPSDKCVALPPAGEPCAQTELGLSCAEGLRCDQGTCVVESPLVCGLGPAVFKTRI